jgi:hypothetical protein
MQLLTFDYEGCFYLRLRQGRMVRDVSEAFDPEGQLSVDKTLFNSSFPKFCGYSGLMSSIFILRITFMPRMTEKMPHG